MSLGNIHKRNYSKRLVVVMVAIVFTGYSLLHLHEQIYIPLQELFQLTILNETVRNGRYVSVCKEVFNERRLGNMLFVLSALFFVSKHTGRQPVMPQYFRYQWIDHIFVNDIPRLPNRFIYDQGFSYVINEKGGLNFDINFKKIHMVEKLKNATTILICGYFQSCKYVEDVEMELRHFLKFKEDTVKSVDDFINKQSSFYTDVSYIGLHVRRGDFAMKKHLAKGFAVVDENYINLSMNHIIASFSSSRTLIIFVCSDDIYWIKKVIEKLKLLILHENLKVVYSIDHDAAFDLCLLSKCNASIISTGTFSWWSAWLANTSAVYYSLYPVPDTNFSKGFVAKEYYPSNWIGYP